MENLEIKKLERLFSKTFDRDMYSVHLTIQWLILFLVFSKCSIFWSHDLKVPRNFPKLQVFHLSCMPLPELVLKKLKFDHISMTFVTSCTGYLSSRESASKSACMYAGVLTMRHLLTCRTCSLPSRMSMLCGAIVPPIEPT